MSCIVWTFFPCLYFLFFLFFFFFYHFLYSRSVSLIHIPNADYFRTCVVLIDIIALCALFYITHKFDNGYRLHYMYMESKKQVIISTLDFLNCMLQFELRNYVLVGQTSNFDLFIMYGYIVNLWHVPRNLYSCVTNNRNSEFVICQLAFCVYVI